MDELKQKLKIWGIGGLLLMMTLIDSVSQILSTAVDGFFAVCIALIAWWARPRKKKEE